MSKFKQHIKQIKQLLLVPVYLILKWVKISESTLEIMLGAILIIHVVLYFIFFELWILAYAILFLTLYILASWNTFKKMINSFYEIYND